MLIIVTELFNKLTKGHRIWNNHLEIPSIFIKHLVTPTHSRKPCKKELHLLAQNRVQRLNIGKTREAKIEVQDMIPLVRKYLSEYRSL